MGLENLQEIKDALASCGAEPDDVAVAREGTKVAGLLADSVVVIGLLEKLRIPVPNYLTNGVLNDRGKNRVRAIGELSEDHQRAEDLINSKDLYAELTILDIGRLVSYERAHAA